MSLINSLNASIVGQAVGFIGIGALIDALIQEDKKSQISSFMFGDKAAGFRNFEQAVIAALLTPFTRKGQISPKRVCIYSFISSCAILVFSIILQLGDRSSDIYSRGLLDNMIIVSVGVVTLTYMAFPGDLLSINITKSLFVNREIGVLVLPLVWVANILLSIALPTTLVLVLVYLAAKDPGTITPMMGALLIAMMTGTVISAIFISLVQGLIISVGIVVRLLLLLTRQADSFTKHARLRESPITVCFIIAYVVIIFSEALF